MKTLYIDCGMGCAGDMLTAALLELHPDPERFLTKMNTVLGGRVTISARKDSKCGITGTHVSVLVDGEEEAAQDISMSGHLHAHEHPGHEHSIEAGHPYMHMDGEQPHAHIHPDNGHFAEANHHDHTHPDGDHSHAHPHEAGHHHHAHTGVQEILAQIQSFDLPQPVKNDAIAVYQLIAEAESAVHGHPIENIHFHEVGSLDALADVLNVCALIYELHPDKILASPVNAGSGHVHCAHGILPVPAPATERLLRGIPWYSGHIHAELCTPTGAALLKHFVSDFGPMPVMRITACGYGTGNKNFEAANVVRTLLGENDSTQEQILELACNLDDMTSEEMGFAMEQLLEAGALDVYFTNIGMKKCRPAVMLTCMCRPEQRDELLRLLFLHTTTLGVREYTCSRYSLSRSFRTENTAFGPVRIKTAEGYGITHEKAEYDDLARLARENGCSIAEIRRTVL